MIALFVLRVLGNLAIHMPDRSVGHQLVMSLPRRGFFLLETMEHDVRIGNALEPRETAFHRLRIGRASGCVGDAFRPARRVVLFLLREAIQDVLALGSGSRFAR